MRGSVCAITHRMTQYTCLSVCLALIHCGLASATGNCFPKDFRFGVGSSAYQYEGAWDEGGKGENIWDRAIHTIPGFVADGSNADVACDSYHKIDEDVALLKDLGVSVYRISISWSRILPDGLANNVNQEGIRYYKTLIKKLKDAGIEPMVTMYHWDLPVTLKSIGGWTNSALVEYFADYARLLYKLFGDDVKIWATFNEPFTFCVNHLALLVNDTNINGIGEYLCAHNVLKAHARAYRIYDREFRAKQKGKVSIVLNIEWIEPLTNSTEDAEAAERTREFIFGWFANPIFLGDYPAVMKQKVEARSAKEGYPRSRLPKFTTAEKLYIKGTHDYVGLNEYTSTLVRSYEIPIGAPSVLKDIGVLNSKDEKWPPSGVDWLRVEPTGIRKALTWIWKKYRPKEIVVTENGYADDGTTEDEKRISYHQDYLSNVLKAVNEDDVNVTGYMLWSFLDNFEWRDGYRTKFGIYSVNFTDPARKRTPKNSAAFYKKLCETKCLIDNSV